MDRALILPDPMTRLSAALGVCALLTGAMSAAGCSSAEPVAGDGCVDNAAAALKTCAKATTLNGVDVSSYQGTVNWTQIKGAGKQFAFVRISDGLNSIDSKFPTNWPAMKAAGVVRGSYQFFRPSQDPAAQAQLVIDKITAAGGLKAGDLPPVLDLESADGLAGSVVVAKAKIWLEKIETKLKVKPLVYTAAFMSDVIGTGFGKYTLWVANYGTTCPTMPSGWTDWQFWQNADNGKVTGISGAVDTDFFNGTLPQLQALTVKDATPPKPGSPDTASATIDPFVLPTGDTPNDGSQGATLGSGTPSQETTGAPLTPCQ